MTESQKLEEKLKQIKEHCEESPCSSKRNKNQLRGNV